jgi:hypothetical protein
MDFVSILETTSKKYGRRTLKQVAYMSLILAVAAAFLSGCGKDIERASLEGVVRVDGKPLEKGAINLVPLNAGAGSSAGAEIIGGRYSIQGAKAPLPGKYRVEIVGTRKTGRQVPNPMRAGEKVDEIEMCVPAKYNTDSKLEVDLKVGKNAPINFDLKVVP